MSIQRIGNGVTAILLLLCVLISAIIFLQWQSYLHEDHYIDAALESDTTSQDTTDIFLGNQSKTIKLTHFSDILARPLFTEGRLPYEDPEQEKVITQQTGLPKLRLEGIAISPDSRVAVVRDLTDNSLLRLAEGMIHKGWRITSVNSVEATLERGAETHKLPLELVNRPMTKSTTSRFRLPNSNKPAKPRPGVKSPRDRTKSD